MTRDGHFRVRGHCIFRWELRGEREARTLIVDGHQCRECVEDLRTVAALTGCAIADERHGATAMTETAEQASSPI